MRVRFRGASAGVSFVVSLLGEEMRQPAVHTRSFGQRVLDDGRDSGRGGWWWERKRGDR
jgi:hypothetical protein